MAVSALSQAGADLHFSGGSAMQRETFRSVLGFPGQAATASAVCSQWAGVEPGREPVKQAGPQEASGF